MSGSQGLKVPPFQVLSKSLTLYKLYDTESYFRLGKMSKVTAKNSKVSKCSDKTADAIPGQIDKP